MKPDNVIKLPENRTEDALRGRIRGLLSQGLTQTQLAREAGLSASSLSSWLRESYAGDNAAVEDKLSAWLGAYDTKESLDIPAAPVWVDTPTGNKILTNLRYAQMMQAIVPIYGAAGVGKTRAAKRYAATQPNAWLATMSPDTSTKGSALEEIALAVGLRDLPSRPSHLRRAIVTKLTDTRGLLILDEAQHLSMDALETVRRIFDGAEVGLALLGNDKVYARLAGGGARQSDFARLYSRLGNRLNLAGVSREDAEALLNEWHIKDAETVRLLVRIAQTPGALRVMTYAVQLATMAAKGQGRSLGAEHVRGAWAKLGGTE